MANVLENVHHGVKLLDRKVPGWATCINTKTLALDNPEQCVLGQLFGSFRYGLAALKIIRPAAFGFEITAEDPQRIAPALVPEPLNFDRPDRRPPPIKTKILAINQKKSVSTTIHRAILASLPRARKEHL